MSKLLDVSARFTLALAQSAALVAVILLFAAARALAATPDDARDILKKNVSATYDSDIEAAAKRPATGS